ncbi:MAG: adenylate/guanylate cyclase domain-containing protein [Polyangiaceae bacterium]|nr:adenylate/guanylate cyclase domain-containing protein [Polyangiaceae bacterium]
MVEPLASRDIDDTLRQARDRTELEIARYRVWVYASVTPLAFVVATVAGAGNFAVAVYFAVWLLVALGLRVVVRRLGARPWLRSTALVLDVAAMSLVFPMSATGAADPVMAERFALYVFGASLVAILALNFLRDDGKSALIGSAAALVAFFGVLLPLRGFEPAQLPVAIILALMGVIGAAMARQTRTTLEIFARTRLLRRYVPEQLVSEMVDGDSQLDDRERVVTVLASDLRGFTAMSERLSPKEIVRQLNDYHRTMLDVVHGHGGMLDKFIGDGMLVVFGLRDDDPAPGARAAVGCARDMLLALAELNATRRAAGLAPLRAGIGVHTGPVVAGSIGAADRMEFTVIGDTVNTAARLEGLTKEAGESVLISSSTAEHLDGGVEELAAMSVRGKQDALRVFALRPALT